MKYITELDTERIKKIAGKMPKNSALVNLNHKTYACNVAEVTMSMQAHTCNIELRTVKDLEGRYGVLIRDDEIAKQLYEIAEPDGPDWDLLLPCEREKYIRMQDAGVKP